MFTLYKCFLTLSASLNLLQDVVEIYTDCQGDYEVIFLGICFTEFALLAFFSILVTYQTQKHIGVYHKHLESAVISMTAILSVLLSTICQVIVITLEKNQQQEGELLVITLRDCLWIFPMIYLLFIPKVQYAVIPYI